MSEGDSSHVSRSGVCSFQAFGKKWLRGPIRKERKKGRRQTMHCRWKRGRGGVLASTEGSWDRPAGVRSLHGEEDKLLGRLKKKVFLSVLDGRERKDGRRLNVFDFSLNSAFYPQEREMRVTPRSGASISLFLLLPPGSLPNFASFSLFSAQTLKEKKGKTGISEIVQHRVLGWG